MNTRPIKTLLLLALLILSYAGLEAQAITVWPGDANNNGTANHVDVLLVARNFGQAGPARDSIITAWAPQLLLTPWPNPSGQAVNPAHSDCDGSGLVDGDDFAVIDQNYGQVQGGIFLQDSSTLVNFTAPLLQVAITLDSLTVIGSTTFAVDIFLGQPALGVDSIYGLAFTLELDSLLMDSVLNFLPGSMFAFDSNVVALSHPGSRPGTFDVAISRLNGTNISGAGHVGTIIVALDDNIRVAADYSFPVGIPFASANTLGGHPVFLSAQSDTLQVVLNQLNPPAPGAFQLYPVPASGMLNLRAELCEEASIRIVDLQGRVLRESYHPNLKHIQIPVADLPQGAYLLELRSRQGTARRRFVVGD